MTKRFAIFCCLTMVFLFDFQPASFAQADSWTNSASGKWEDASSWSLGVLPGTNQDIMLTNAGAKMLTIGPETAQDFPNTLSVNSVSISSPSNAFNMLLLNNVGIGMPLTVRSLSIESNSAMTMFASALHLNGPNGVGMQVGGQFNQTDSAVYGNQINVGYLGPGIYNLTSGSLAVTNLWVGGDFGGIFNQTGGTNNTGIVGLDPGGTYNFSGGDFNATVYFNGPCTFNQTGGRVTQWQDVYNGTYIQSGGTNFGGLEIGSYAIGNYVLSNGYSFPSTLDIGTFGTVHQFGGTQIVTNQIYLAPDAIDGDPRAPHDGFTPGGVYWLSGGTLMAGSVLIYYNYTQDGGTNLVAGGIQISNQAPVVLAGVQLADGLLKADSVTVWSGSALQQSGGCLMANNLIARGQVPPFMSKFGPDINCAGGALIVSNIDVESDYFGISGTVVKQTGTLTLDGMGTLLPGPGVYTFGALVPISGIIDFGSNYDCQLRFSDTSSESWSNALLTIKHWSGSIYGGGSQQIFFGTNSAGLTAEQLSHIIFQNPPATPPHPPNDLPSGLYFARILATGEIVPDTGAPLPPRMFLSSGETNGAMQLSLGGDIGRSYDIEVSTDLVNWVGWTNEFNSNGTVSLPNCEPTNGPQLFYRARLAP